MRQVGLSIPPSDDKQLLRWLRDAVQQLARASQITELPAMAPGAKSVLIYDTTLSPHRTNWATAGEGLSMPATIGGRLTLTSGTPVTTSDVTAATTLYYTPYGHGHIALYDGTGWIVGAFSEVSLSLSGYTSSTPYDIWGYLSSGTLALDSTAWTNDTTRATALAKQDGVYVKSGDAARRYLGTIRITGTTGQCEDSLAKRYVWNMYNRRRRPMAVLEATDTWTYSTASWRQANNSTANQLDFVLGLNEDAVSCSVSSLVTSDTATVHSVRIGIGLDSTTTLAQMVGIGNVSTTGQTISASYTGLPGVGRHYLAWLEYGGGSDTQTWRGDAGAPGSVQYGIAGDMWG